jgi:hypothetical protein
MPHRTARHERASMDQCRRRGPADNGTDIRFASGRWGVHPVKLQRLDYERIECNPESKSGDYGTLGKESGGHSVRSWAYANMHIG